MAKNLPQPFALELALEFGLEATSRSVFGRIKGIILAITKIMGSTVVAVNMSHLNESKREEIRQILLKLKPKGLERSSNDSLTGCVTFSFRHSPVIEGKAVQTAIKRLLIHIQETVPAGPAGAIELYSETPLLVEQIEQIKQRLQKSEKKLPHRIAMSLASGIGLALLLTALIHFFPRISSLLASPLPLLLLDALTIAKFRKGGESGRLNLILESAALFLVTTVVFLFQILGVAVVTYPTGYRKTLDLILLFLDRWLPKLAPLCIFQISILSVTILGLVISRRRWIPVPRISINKNLIETAEAQARASRKMLIFFFSSIFLAVPILLGSLVSVDFSSENESYNNIFVAVVLSHLFYAGALLIWTLADHDLVTATRRDDGLRMSLLTIPMVLILPIMLTAASGLWISNANILFDHSPSETRLAQIAPKPVSIIYSPCWPVIDATSRKPLAIQICEPKAGPLRGGETVKYSYQSGWLKTGRLYGPEVVRPSTWDNLLKLVGSDSKARSIDIEHLVTDVGQRKVLTKTYLPQWRARCQRGGAVYCRLSAYLVNEADGLTEKLNLLKRGCNLGDRVSCTGLLIKNPNDTWASEKALQLELSDCKSGDLEACAMYYSSAKNGRYPEADLIFALKRLCQNGDSPACEKLAWAENRL